MYNTLKLVTLTLTVSTFTLLASIAAEAPPAQANKGFTVTPKVTLDSGYTTRANHLGLQMQKNSAFVSSSVSLQNDIVTPTLSSTYYIAGENKSQIVVDGSLSKGLTLGPITAVSYAGVQKRIIDGAFEDSFSAYAGMRFVKIPVLSVVATPYVTVSRDFNYDLFGATIGLDRTFTIGKIELTPRAEAFLFDKHTAYTAGGNLAYAGFKYVKPYVDVSYVTTDTALAGRKFEGNLSATAGVKMSF